MKVKVPIEVELSQYDIGHVFLTHLRGLCKDHNCLMPELNLPFTNEEGQYEYLQHRFSFTFPGEGIVKIAIYNSKASVVLESNCQITDPVQLAAIRLKTLVIYGKEPSCEVCGKVDSAEDPLGYTNKGKLRCDKCWNEGKEERQATTDD